VRAFSFRSPSVAAGHSTWTLGRRVCVARPPEGRFPVCRRSLLRNFSAVIECDPGTGLVVGFVPGFTGAHSQGATLDELNVNLREVTSMLLEDGDPVLESEFVGVQDVAVA